MAANQIATTDTAITAAPTNGANGANGSGGTHRGRGKLRPRRLDERGWLPFNIEQADAPPHRDAITRSVYGGIRIALSQIPDGQWHHISGEWDVVEAGKIASALREHATKVLVGRRVDIKRIGPDIYVHKEPEVQEAPPTTTNKRSRSSPAQG